MTPTIASRPVTRPPTAGWAQRGNSARSRKPLRRTWSRPSVKATDTSAAAIRGRRRPAATATSSMPALWGIVEDRVGPRTLRSMTAASAAATTTPDSTVWSRLPTISSMVKVTAAMGALKAAAMPAAAPTGMSRRRFCGDRARRPSAVATPRRSGPSAPRGRATRRCRSGRERRTCRPRRGRGPDRSCRRRRPSPGGCRSPGRWAPRTGEGSRRSGRRASAR